VSAGGATGATSRAVRPAAGSSRPAAGSSRPAAGSSRPAAGSPHAAGGTSRPNGGSPHAAGASPRPTDASSSDHLRLFVALELPEAARNALVSFRDAATDPAVWRPLPPEAIHLTLAFLGRRSASDVATITGVLREAAGPPPRLALERALLLPPRRARVLCVSLADPDGTLRELQARVSDGLAAAGVYEPEKRAFRAHATVARLRPRERPPRAVDAAPEALTFRGETLTLFVSRLHPHGAQYDALERVHLR
jgi:RNA 2',3'-cyclic 3'-phosphodiesterase